MKKLMNKNLILKLLVFTLIVFFCVQTVSAGGFGISPSIYEIKNALKGNEYQKTFVILNGDNKDITVDFTVSEGPEGWVSFFNPSNLDEPISSITATANSYTNFVVKYNIPSDTANGNYNLIMEVKETAEAEEGAEPTQLVNFVMRIKGVIEVVGDEQLSGEVVSFHVESVESGQVLRLTSQFQNNGNVVATPEYDIIISKQDGGFNEFKVVDEFKFTETSTKVGETNTIDIEWDTEGFGVGDFKAKAIAKLGGKIISEKEAKFEIFERGTLSAEVSVLKTVEPEEYVLGEIAKIEVELYNTGKMDVLAKLSGEIYLNNKLVDKIESDEVLIEVNRKASVIGYFTPKEQGDYVIKRQITFQGNKLDLDDLSIKLKGNKITGNVLGGSQGSFPWIGLFITIGIIVIGLVIVGVTYLNKKNQIKGL